MLTSFILPSTSEMTSEEKARFLSSGVHTGPTGQMFTSFAPVQPPSPVMDEPTLAYPEKKEEQSRPSFFVIKRSNARVELNTEKIRSKLKFLSTFIYPLSTIDFNLIINKVKESLHSEIKTSEIDLLAASQCVSLSVLEPEYGVLASRVLMNDHHKKTMTGFKDKMEKLYRRKDKHHNRPCPLLNTSFYKFVCTNQRELEAMIDYNRDYLYDVFGFNTIKKQYLLKIDDEVVERPQDHLLRAAIAVCMNPNDFKDQKAMKNIHLIYDLLSCLRFTFATPVMANSGTVNQQLSSCFLLKVGDSLESINKIQDDCAKISKSGGGIGIDISSIRSKGELIRGTNGKTNGVLNALKIYESTALMYDQGGTRKGSFAHWYRDWHPDVASLIESKKPIGEETGRCRGLFSGIMLTDKFWKAIEEDDWYYLIDPQIYPGLDLLYGEEFEKVYDRLVREGKYKKKIKARELNEFIQAARFESGVPYGANFDNVNRKNNLKHYSPITMSNLCAEITLPASETEYGVCNLASLVLPSFVVEEQDLQLSAEERLERYRTPNYHRWEPRKKPVFDYKSLAEIAQHVAEAMDKVIDRNYYPVQEALISNLLHRPIGIGCSGFADVCCMIRVPYDSSEGVKLTSRIYETVAYGALSASAQIARTKFLEINKETAFLNMVGKEEYQQGVSRRVFAYYEMFKNDYEQSKVTGKTPLSTDTQIPITKDRNAYLLQMIVDYSKLCAAYPSYHYGTGAPISHGEFQWKMWGLKTEDLSGMWDWESLEEMIKKFGVRNSLMTAQMPTASVAQTVGCNEGCEPYTSNIYRRVVLAGDFVIVNRHLVNDLKKLGLWNATMKDYILANEGSIQDIPNIPDEMKKLYLTAWDMKQQSTINHAAARGPFLDHTQSLNIFIGNRVPVQERANMLFQSQYQGWKKGLKTGIYYLRTQPAQEAQKFTVPLEMLTSTKLTSVKSTDFKPVTVEYEEMGCLNCGT
jgi:ribonucleoside-diphosphate reductase alpha subunit